MNDKRNDADEASFEDLVSFETLPPPPGNNEGDVHNARTTVAALPDSFLDSLKAAAAERVDSNRAAGDLVATRRAKPFEMPPGILPPPASAPVLEAAPVTPRHVPRPAAPELPALTPREPGVEQPTFSSDQLASAFGAALETRASEPRVDAAHAAFPPVLAVPPAPAPPFSAPPFSAPPAALSAPPGALSAPPGAFSSAPPGAFSASPGALSAAPGPVNLPLAESGLSGATDAGVARAPRSRKLLVAAAVAFVVGMGILFALVMLRRRFM